MLQAPNYNQGSLCLSSAKLSHSAELRPGALASAGWAPGPDLPGALASWRRQIPAAHSGPVLAGVSVRHKPSSGVWGQAWLGSCCGGPVGRTWGQNVGAVAGQARGTFKRCMCQPETRLCRGCADPSLAG